MDWHLLICLIFLARLRIFGGQILGCNHGQWQCDDGSCIPAVWRCDGDGDCLDGSDEVDCTVPQGSDCLPGQFPCVDSVGCVNASARCDGQKQCPTGSDEENCPAIEGCLDSDWTCQNNICIPKELRCNGVNDCMDNSDEKACGLCSEDSVRCPDGTCLSAEEWCDGKFHCSDGSDEPITCGRLCSVNNGGCSHVCTDEPWGALCSCPAGYKLSPDGSDCEDLDECASPFAACAHHCTNTIGSYHCHCREGFKLNENSACVASGNAVRLLLVEGSTLGLLNVKSQQFEVIQSSVLGPVALAFDVARGWYYWADSRGNIYKSDGQHSWTAYTGEPGIKGLACDWLNGNLFWTNEKTESIYIQSTDGNSYTTLLSKNIRPSELVIMPVESLMFWINIGPGDRVTIAKSWMDGSERSTLAVITAQSAHSLTADVAARRLYWISDFKRSIETVKVDGTGRYSLTELFSSTAALSLAVFESLFYWIDDKGLWQVPQNQPSQNKPIWKAELPLLAVYHELQQPQGYSACEKTPCDLCQLTKSNPAGFTCSCPNLKLLLLDGTCENPRFLYATNTDITLLEFKEKGSTETQLFNTNEGILSFELDWDRGWLYWANQTGHIQRTNLTEVTTEVVPAPLPVCLINVDQKSGSLYWVSCHQNSIGTITADSHYLKQLYHTTKEIQNLHLDWLRGTIIWLEEDRILSMSMLGGEAKELLHIAGGVRGGIAFDLRANNLLWNSKMAGLTTLSLMRERSHQAGRRWIISGSVVAALEPFLLSISDDIMTLWDQRDGRPIQDTTLTGHVVRVIAALMDIQTVQICRKPYFLCRHSSICLSQAQLCDRTKDCPEGDDEFCPGTCLSKEDFECRDRSSCISRNLVCDGRSDCHDGSDEDDCPTAAPPTSRANVLKCRRGSKLCKDGKECVLYTHVCDGEDDCEDGSDELGCDALQQNMTAIKTNINPSNKTPRSTTHPPQTLPACISPFVHCPPPAYHCISPNQFCNGHDDCPDGFDEKNCVKSCPLKNDFLCKDHRSCISKSLVCDGRFHCYDGSDEVDCQTAAPPALQKKILNCRLGLTLCRDGNQCVLNNRVCDGKRDCQDGSDEEECNVSERASTMQVQKRPLNESPVLFTPFTQPHNKLPCSSPSVLCPFSSLCIETEQICDGKKDCPDGSDEKCINDCPFEIEFLCKDQRSCIFKSLVCDGRSHCQDGSDELNCPSMTAAASKANVLQCHRNAKPCNDGTECVLLSHICDGERDCTDGSDEEGCPEICKKGEFQCSHGKMCIPEDQVCDGWWQCQDHSDEVDCWEPTKSCEHRCADGKRCIPKKFLCDGERDCVDGSDELGCNQVTATSESPVFTFASPCIAPSVLCPGSSLCISQNQLCDGQRDCPDGFDENDCVVQCENPSDFLCSNQKKCISEIQVCDGRAQCPDGSDEKRCQLPNPASSISGFGARSTPLRCRIGFKRCKNGHECVMYSHLCDGEKDCGDGSDEEGCVADAASTTTATEGLISTVSPSPINLPTKQPCTSPSILCPGSSLCIEPEQICNGKKDCPDGSDEKCVTCANERDFLCKDRRSCISKSLVCDGRSHCQDGSDETNCPSVTVPASKANVLQCHRNAKPCSDGTECVLFSHICDGEQDCMDGSDEEGCPETCKKGEFQCSHGKMCIPEAQVCDGRWQCRDHSDEVDCWEPTKSCEHRCADGKRCIPKKFLCDGERDCVDGSDETGCNHNATTTESPDFTFASRCIPPSVLCPGSSLCISKYQLCDGQRNCPDGFDENGCAVHCENSNDFLCSDQRKCIPGMQVCDGRAQCPDGSDENRCQLPNPAVTSSVDVLMTRSTPLKCRNGFKLCKDGLDCVMYSHLCDGEKDCKDGSDEEGCAVQCKAGEFQCSHGKRCIPQEQVCDGQNDCHDRSDETDCSTMTEGCHQRCDNDTRCIPKSFLCDGERDCADGSDEEKCGLVSCVTHQYRCASGQCISEALRCDGYADCGDGSDEMHCSKPPRCLTKLRCPQSHKCLQKEWLCDGEDDCQDGSDEKNCSTSPVKCLKFQWQCGDSSQCIPLSWRCDGKEDCYNGIDETKCSQRKCPSHLYQCDSGECVNTNLVCNGITNCADGSDEGTKCVQHSCSTPSAPFCDHRCVSTPYGPKCYCAAGFRLSSTMDCVDIDECVSAPHAICKHICLNTRGSYSCHCHPGFYLEPDNKSCKTKDEPLLLASVQSQLFLLGVHSGTLHLLLSTSRPAFSLDYHWVQQRIYWLSTDYQSIRWVDMENPTNRGNLVKGVKSDFIAVDWVGKNLYWVDGLVGQILAVKLSNTTVRSQDCTVVLGEDLEQPSSLVLLPHKGLMLWSEIGSTPQIEQSGMDGSGRKVVVSHSLSWPVSLAYDLLDNRVYWADEKLRCIGSASLDGDDIKILQLAETPNPFSVVVFNDRVFWSDTKRRVIRSADKNTGKDQKVVLKRPGQPFGLKLMHAISQPAVSSPCDHLRCSHLCLLAPPVSGRSTASGSSEATAVCRCPKGLLLSKDNITCSQPRDSSFILLLSRNTVYQIYLRSMRRDGVALKKMANSRVLALPGVNEAMGLDVSIEELYVAYAGSVDVLKMGSSRSRQGLTPAGQILKLKDESVMALAVDWVTFNLYWSSSSRPNIHVTSRHGGYTTSLLQGSLTVKATTSIALHPPSGQLCFTAVVVAGGESQIEVDCAWMDGRNKMVLWRKSKSPISLVFSNKGTRIYWADTDEGVISSIGVDGTGYKQFKAGPDLIISFTYTENILFWVTQGKDVTRLWFSDGLQPKQLWFETKTSVVEIRAYSNDSQSGNNGCSKNNGGCVHLCLAYPGGRTCRCGRGFYSINVTSCAPVPSCPPGEESCFDRSNCISSSKLCDGHTDCPDQSDEQDCPASNPASFGPKATDGHTPELSSSSPKANKNAVSVKNSASCDLQRCNNHGSCITEGSVTRCQCLSGYKGEFCQEEESQSHVGVIFGVFCLIAALITAGFIFTKRRGWAFIRSRSTDKETLMANMGLPCDHDSDSEEVESPVDGNPPAQLQ